MKCIKSVKPIKNVDSGTILRVSDVDADKKVKSGDWKFTTKSDWKLNLKSIIDEKIEDKKEEKAAAIAEKKEIKKKKQTNKK